ncbi:MAG: DUF6491 family protein [Pseudomonadales bacterium]|jgi:hypothetical protein|nr:DUF6491 family protein [Pseudomonadales bacterium]
MKATASFGLIVTLAASLTACSNLPRMSDEERLALFRDHAGESIASFSLLGANTGFSGWTALGREALAVWPRTNEGYLLDLNGICEDLNFATGISLSNLGNRVSAGFDYVYVRGVNNPTALPCLINTIRPLDTRGLEAAQKELRQAEVIEREQQAGGNAATPG